MAVNGENRGVNYNAHTTGDVRSGLHHIGVVDTGVSGELRHHQQLHEEAQIRGGPLPGAVWDSQGQLNMKGEISLVS